MRYPLLLLLLALLAALLFGLSLMIGPSVVLVMQDIRLPRAILGLLIGAALGLSGPRCRGICEIPWQNRGLWAFPHLPRWVPCWRCNPGLPPVSRWPCRWRPWRAPGRRCF
jgi:hypothetical protein